MKSVSTTCSSTRDVTSNRCSAPTCVTTTSPARTGDVGSRPRCLATTSHAPARSAARHTRRHHPRVQPGSLRVSNQSPASAFNALAVRDDPQLGRRATGLHLVLLEVTCKALVPSAAPKDLGRAKAPTRPRHRVLGPFRPGESPHIREVMCVRIVLSARLLPCDRSSSRTSVMVNVSPDLERIRPIAAKICSRAVPPIMMPLTDFPHFSSAGSSDDRCSCQSPSEA